MITISIQTIYYFVAIISIICGAAYKLGYLYRQCFAHASTPRLCRYVEGALVYSAFEEASFPNCFNTHFACTKKVTVRAWKT